MKSRYRCGWNCSLLVLLFLVCVLAAAADTVKLKNGRVIKGKVERFDNGEFVVIVEASDPRATGDRRILLVDSVESIEFDAAAAAAGAPSEKLVVLDAQKDVVPTGVQVRKGEKVRITASGEMQFPDGRVSGPKGLDSRESWPFPGERFGVLIAMVGDPQSPIYHVIGENSDFEARRDGELFLQINARSLQGARGAYTARIQSAATAAATTPPPPPAPTTRRQLRYDVNVPADRDWTDSGIDLLAGDTLRVEAEGTINYSSTKTCGPNGGERDWKDLIRALPVNDVGRGALIGMIGQAGAATPFFVGAREEFKVEKAGRLFLGINDDDYRNNRGSFRVRIEIVPGGR